MKKLQFSIEIKATKEKVWNTLWDDNTFRDWANNIDEGMYMIGIMEEGNEVQFLSPTGYGVTSLIKKLAKNQFVSFRHMADTNDSGLREKEWTGGEESYSLKECDGITTLTVALDTPPEQVENFNNSLPKALKRIKELAEK
jgi:hypothetical protein